MAQAESENSQKLPVEWTEAEPFEVRVTLHPSLWPARRPERRVWLDLASRLWPAQIARQRPTLGGASGPFARPGCA